MICHGCESRPMLPSQEDPFQPGYCQECLSEAQPVGAPVGADHDCTEHAEQYLGDGPLGHGWFCGLCNRLLQVG